MVGRVEFFEDNKAEGEEKEKMNNIVQTIRTQLHKLVESASSNEPLRQLAVCLTLTRIRVDFISLLPFSFSRFELILLFSFATRRQLVICLLQKIRKHFRFG